MLQAIYCELLRNNVKALGYLLNDAHDRSVEASKRRSRQQPASLSASPTRSEFCGIIAYPLHESILWGYFKELESPWDKVGYGTGLICEDEVGGLRNISRFLLFCHASSERLKYQHQ